QAVLQAIRVRNRRDEDAAGTEDAACLGDEAAWIAEMLHQLAGHDDVEARILERQRFVEIGPPRLDSELLSLGERLPVGVDSDEHVPGGVRLRQRPVAAAEVEDTLARPADVAAEELDSLRAREAEPVAAPDAVV